MTAIRFGKPVEAVLPFFRCYRWSRRRETVFLAAFAFQHCSGDSRVMFDRNARAHQLVHIDETVECRAGRAA